MPRLAYQTWGESTYSVGGEAYAQIPRRLLGKLSRSAQILLNALLEILGHQTATDIRDKDIQAKTNLHLRTIQRVLRLLEHELKAIIRNRSNGRREIVLVDRLAVSYEDLEKTEQAAAGAEIKAKQGVTTTAREVQRALTDMAALGWVPLFEPGGKCWGRIPGRSQDEPDVELRLRLRRYEFEIRALVEQQGRPAKE
jgi:hypothetical protein